MKALIYTDPLKLAYRDAPVPTPGPGEVVVQVQAAGVCGSDIHAYLGHDERRPAPLILGHEAAGEVKTGPQAGRRVTINPLVTCGKCGACVCGRQNLCAKRQIISMPPREGAFAELAAVPESNLIATPDEISFEVAALAEPMAVGWRAARLGLAARAFDEGEALVIGGGAIGLASALALKAMGLKEVVISERSEIRRAYLNERCGVAAVEAPDGAFSLVIDAAGFEQTRALASNIASAGGVIVHVGLGEDLGGLNIRRMTLQEITFIGVYTYSAQDFRDTAQAMFSGRLGPLDWFEVRPLSCGAGVFEEIRAGKVAAPKVILQPGR